MTNANEKVIKHNRAQMRGKPLSKDCYRANVSYHEFAPEGHDFTGCYGPMDWPENVNEECAELAHAALKLARILRDENPMDASLEETRDDVVEEACDVCICLDMADIPLDQGIRTRKLERLMKRLSTAEKGEPDER